MPRTAAALIIGNEILSGKIAAKSYPVCYITQKTLGKNADAL